MEKQMFEKEVLEIVEKEGELAAHLIKTILTMLTPLDCAVELTAAQTVLYTIAANHIRIGVIKDEEGFINHISERARIGIKRILHEMRQLEKNVGKEGAKNVH